MNFTNKNTCINCNRKCGLFKLLKDNELQFFEDNRYEVHHKAGEIIAKQGSLSSYIISFNTGLAKIYIEGDKNKDLILGLVAPTEIVGGPGIFVDSRMHYTVSALVDSTVCLIDIETFKKTISNNGVFAEQYLSTFSKRCISIFDRFLVLTQKHMHGRVAETLLYLSEEIFNKKEFDMILTRQELGEFTAMTKESVCRILKQFKDEEVISLKGNHLIIHDSDQLRRIVQNS